MLQSGVLNLSRQFLSGDKLATYLHEVTGESIHTIILDDNYLRNIEVGLISTGNVIQLSLARNQLTKTESINLFPHLKVLNLSCNLLIQLDGICHLKYLEWINLSGNQLGSIEILQGCPNLVHVDASDNRLSKCPSLCNLKNLHTLLLQQNLLNDLQHVPENFPRNVRILSLANNRIADLNQIKFLATLPSLEQLSIAKNSCIDHSYVASVSSMPTFNYRPFVINWCNNLSILDGIQVSQRENMKAEWLLSQGKGRAFEIGQHLELTEYLSSVSPHLGHSCKTDEPENMDKIHEQKRRIGKKSLTGEQASPSKKNVHKPESVPIDRTKPLANRVPEVEKRRRVQAWLGNASSTPDQQSTHKDQFSMDDFHSVTSEGEPKCYRSDMSIDDLNTSTHLLLSESEFINGADLPQSTATSTKVHVTKSNNLQNPQLCTGSLRLIQKHYDSPLTTPSSDSTDQWVQKTLAAKVVERSLPKPASSVLLPSMRINAAQYTTELDAGEILVASNMEKSLSMSKYEEYEMRPIKPLNTDLQLEMYGSMSVSSPQTSTKRPPPLKKNSGITSKHAVTGLKKSVTTNRDVSMPMPRSSVKKQSNIMMKKSVPTKKESSKSSKNSPHRKRQQQQPILSKEPLNKIVHIKRKKTSGLSDRMLENQHESVDEGQDETTSSKSYTIRKHVAGEGNVGSRSTPFHVFPNDVKHVMAATKIQALWRGFAARCKNPKVIEIRHELRYRRSEQYISLLCHEIQMLKEKQEAEKRMRELQTEAIRFMWAQIRQLQQDQKYKQENVATPEYMKYKSLKPNPYCYDKSHKLSRSPRRLPKSSSPRFAQNSRHIKVSTKSNQQCGESESVVSSTCDEDTLVEYPSYTQAKKADVSWKDDVDANIFHIADQMPRIPPSFLKEKLEETDEGRGSLTTDVDGIQNSDTDVKQKDDQHLKSTVEQLQQQVLQLQCALLSFSDKLVNSNESENLEVPSIQAMLSEDEDVKTEVSVQEISDVCVDCGSRSPDMNREKETEDTVIVSARDDLPKISLQGVLLALDSALLEQELWSLCEQACFALNKRKDFFNYISTENIFVRKDGVVVFDDGVKPENMDELFIAPEVNAAGEKQVNFKSSIYGLSVALWSAADFQMREDEAPSFSEQFESLLVSMSHDDFKQRADVAHVLQMCEEHHSKFNSNSLEVCSSLFLEASDFHRHKKRKLGTKILDDILNTGKQQTKAEFVNHVVPEIRSFSFSLKPVAERKLQDKAVHYVTPHEQLMEEIRNGTVLKKSQKPRIYTIKDMFVEDPTLLQKLNILPGQRRRNLKALQLSLRRKQPSGPNSQPRSGIPTPPRDLRAEIKHSNLAKSSELELPNDSCSVILRWHPAHVFDKQGNEMKEAVLGYRIYVNGQPKGMVAGTKTRALLDGLHRSTEYRIHVHAFAALGESNPSNIVIVYITQPDVTVQQEIDAAQTKKPMKSSKQHPENTDCSHLLIENWKKDLSPSTNSSQALSKPKVKICAVFPKQDSLEIQQEMSHANETTTVSHGSPLNNSSDSWTTAVSHEDQKKSAGHGEDIVDRVLRRYGIQKSNQNNTSTTESSQSRPAASEKQERLQSSGGCMSTDDDGVNSYISDDTHISQHSNHSSSSVDNITPRSKALLEQLKDELLM